MEKSAIARGLDLPISTKHTIEICNFIRYKTIDHAKKELNLVLQKKLVIPLKRFHKDRGHKKSNGPGFYPKKATKEMINLLNLAEANAQHNGLGSNLFLKKIVVNKASSPTHAGRKRGHMKRTHVEIEVEEIENKK